MLGNRDKDLRVQLYLKENDSALSSVSDFPCLSYHLANSFASFIGLTHSFQLLST